METIDAMHIRMNIDSERNTIEAFTTEDTAKTLSMIRFARSSKNLKEAFQLTTKPRMNYDVNSIDNYLSMYTSGTADWQVKMIDVSRVSASTKTINFFVDHAINDLLDP
jgi:hypothetical protein